MKGLLIGGGIARGSMGGTTAVPLPSGQVFRARIGSYQGKSAAARRNQNGQGRIAHAWSELGIGNQGAWTEYAAEQMALANEAPQTISRGYGAFMSLNRILQISGSQTILTSPPKVEAPVAMPSAPNLTMTQNPDGTYSYTIQLYYDQSSGDELTYSVVYISQKSFNADRRGKVAMTLLNTVNDSEGPVPNQVTLTGTLNVPNVYISGQNIRIKVKTFRGGKRYTDIVTEYENDF